MDAINLQDTFFEHLATTFAHMHQQNKTATNTASGETAKAKGFSHTEKIRMLHITPAREHFILHYNTLPGVHIDCAISA
eukprot:scaffold67648_cov38-Attheya_sp.AAC.1